MIALFLLLVIAAIALGIVGVVAKGLLYLLIIGIVVFLGALTLAALRMPATREAPGAVRHRPPRQPDHYSEKNQHANRRSRQAGPRAPRHETADLGQPPRRALLTATSSGGAAAQNPRITPEAQPHILPADSGRPRVWVGGRLGGLRTAESGPAHYASLLRRMPYVTAISAAASRT